MNDQQTDASVFPLSFGQERLWFLAQLDAGGALYNVPLGLRLRGALDVEALRAALAAVVARHEALRTGFVAQAGRPVQVVLDQVDVALPLLELDGDRAEAQRIARRLAGEPFDLARAPLLRARLLRLAAQEHLLVLCLHHIVFDGWSLGVLLRELSEHYNAHRAGRPPRLPALSIQYADYAVWQRAQLDTRQLREQLAFWQAQLAGAPELLQLPTDRPRSGRRSFAGGRVSRQLPAPLATELHRLAREHHSTLFCVLLAALQAQLARLSGQHDLSIGTPVAGREHPQTEPLIGFFTNTLVLRSQLDPDPTFQQLLQQARRSTLAALDHQTLPFERLVEHLKPHRTLTHTPLFQIVLNLQPPFTPPPFTDLQVELLPHPSGIAKFDLTVDVTTHPTGPLDITAEYSSDLFDQDTVAHMVAQFETILAGAVADPDTRLSRLPLLTPDESRRLLAAPRVSDAGRPPRGVHELVAEQARRPDAPAVIAGGATRTYGELDRRAEQLADALRRLGVGPGSIVAVMAQDGLQRVEGTLAVLKAGAAFALLDPADPPERRTRQLASARVQVLLTDRGDAGGPGTAAHGQPLLPGSLYAHQVGVRFEPRAAGAPARLAQVGWEGGAVVDLGDDALARRVEAFADRTGIACGGTGEVLLAGAAPTAAVAACELFAPLVRGAALAFPQSLDRDGRARAIATMGVTVASLTPGALADLTAATCGPLPPRDSALRLVACTGGELRSDLAGEAARLLGCEVVSLYAPPAGDTVTAFIHGRGCARPIVPIAANGQVAVLDADGTVTPTGAVGEICLPCVRSDDGRRPWVRTGDRGRRLVDGSVEPASSGPGMAWLEGVRVDLDELAATLLEDDAVADCVVRVRVGASGSELVAFVVPAGPLSDAAFEARLRPVLPAAVQQPTLVPVARLPLDHLGRLDEENLAHVPVLDEDLVRLCERRLAALPEVARVAVTVEAARAEEQPFQLMDLLPREPVAADRSDYPVSDSPAVTAGESLSRPADAPRTLVDALARASRSWPGRGTLHVSADGAERFVSYPELQDRARSLLGSLQDLGLRPGDPVVFQLEPSDAFLGALWACLLGGFIVVPVSIASAYEESNATVCKLRHASRLLHEPPVLADAMTAARLSGLGAGSDGRELRLHNVDELPAPSGLGRPHEPDPADVALYLLTSGSTGPPKCVALTHDNILARSEGSRQLNDYTPEDVTLNWMPLDHVGGVVMFHIQDVYVGCRQIHVATRRFLEEPLRWLDAMDRYSVTVTWAPNFAFGLVNDRLPSATRDWDLTSVRVIVNAGEAVVPATARRFLETLAPHGLAATAMRPAWGMSETSSGVTYSIGVRTGRGPRGGFVEVGEPIPGVSVRIVDADDRLLREGEVGRLQVTGLPVLRGYHGDPMLNERSFTADGWFVTGDLGYLGDGKLTLTGREKDVVIVNGVNYANHELEAIAEAVDGVLPSFTAACAVRGPGHDTDALAIFFCPANGDATTVGRAVSTIRERVGREAGITPRYIIPLEPSEVPKTAIGKIERARLRKRFATGELHARADAADDSCATLPRWFHRATWLRRESSVLAELPTGGRALVLEDRAGVGAQLSERLEAAGIACERLGLDEPYERAGALLEATRPTIVVSLRQLGEGSPDDGPLALIRLVQLLARTSPPDRRIDLLVAATGAQQVRDEDALVPARAASVAVLKTAATELPWLRCRHVDLPSLAPEDAAERLVRELRAKQADVEVAYRGDARMVARLEPVDLAGRAPEPLRLRRGGTYLVTGGCGGIGRELSRWLADELDARLLLVGRRPAGAPPSALGAAVRYERVDVADAPALRGAVERAEADWGTTLDGIVHLAGTFHERPLIEESPDGLEAAMQGKATGMHSLELLLDERPNAVLVCFSSVNGLFGGPLAGAYAAANRYVDACCRNLRRRHPGVFCLAWSMWKDVGMGRDSSAREASRARGFQPVSVSRGLASLQVALRHQHAHLVIGLDAANQRMLPLTVGGVEPLQALAAYVEASRPVPPLDLRDRFGAAASCRVVELGRLPMTEEGEIDRDALRLGRPVAGGGFVPPRTKFERRIAELWQELLDVPRVGVGDNFFGLGGHSLLAAQLASRLQATLGVEMPVRMVFECPTLESLVESVLLRRMETDAADHGAAVLAELERMPEDEALVRAARLAEGA